MFVLLIVELYGLVCGRELCILWRRDRDPNKEGLEKRGGMSNGLLFMNQGVCTDTKDGTRNCDRKVNMHRKCNVGE